MTSTTRQHRRVCLRATTWVGVLGLSLLGGCASSLLPKPPAPPALFTLDDSVAEAPLKANSSQPGASAPTLIVNATRSSSGFDTAQIVYVRRANELEYFALNQWVDTPAQMLAPLMVRAIERTGVFKAVLRAPTAAAGELRLDTELVRMQQEFIDPPSRVRLTLRAVLIETATRRVVAWREFDASVPSASEDPYGGVAAANLAAHRVLAELAAFCAEASLGAR
jgi:cholesterol transport system auxiliary component